MPELKIIMGPDDVDAYLDEHNLGDGFAPIDAVLLQLSGTSSGMPCVMFSIEVVGKLVLAKTSYRLFMAAVGGIQGMLQRLEEQQREGN